MSHQALLGRVEVPVTYSPQEAIGLIQDAGVVGAGGGGFPTYLKYLQPGKALIANACETEPGYYCDKLLLQDEPETFVDLFDWMHDTFSIERFVVAAQEVARPYLKEWERLTDGHEHIETTYVPSRYPVGNEHALMDRLFCIRLPRSSVPTDRGFIVNNIETLHNVHRAVFYERPVVSKHLNLYGEGIDGVHALEAPIGASLRDLLPLVGAQTRLAERCKVYDGGPVLAGLAADPLRYVDWVPVRRTTNAFLVVHPKKDRPRIHHYPDPAYRENRIDAPWAPRKIKHVVERIDKVRVPIRAPYVDPGRLVVYEGDEVQRGDGLVTAMPEGRSVGVHASISGTVTAITKRYVEIVSS